MKSILYFAVLFTLISCQRNINLRITETTETATVVKNIRFEGVIFSETMELDTVYEKRFTPTVKEIELAESILRKQWGIIDANKKFKDYSRQYIGTLNHRKKIIHINLLYKEAIVIVNMSTAKNANTWKLDKDKLSTDWVFADNDEYQTSYPSYGRMICVKFDFNKQAIISNHVVKISFTSNKDGKTKLFPYKVDNFVDN